MGKSSEGATESTPSPIDIHVGARIRQRRTALGMSQEKLGDALHLTFQQIQKYERGANRVGASRLYDLCRVFDVTADFFFEGLPNFEPAAGFSDRGAGLDGRLCLGGEAGGLRRGRRRGARDCRACAGLLQDRRPPHARAHPGPRQVARGRGAGGVALTVPQGRAASGGGQFARPACGPLGLVFRRCRRYNPRARPSPAALPPAPSP